VALQLLTTEELSDELYTWLEDKLGVYENEPVLFVASGCFQSTFKPQKVPGTDEAADGDDDDDES
jgi:hypothetical protein